MEGWSQVVIDRRERVVCRDCLCEAQIRAIHVNPKEWEHNFPAQYRAGNTEVADEGLETPLRIVVCGGNDANCNRVGRS